MMIEQRPIPVQSIKGGDDTSTQNLKLLFYLIEIERQAKIFNDSFESAVEAATAGSNADAWKNIQAAMFAGIIVSRMVTYGQDPKAEGWPGTNGQAKKLAKEAKKTRIKELRRLLALPDNEDYPLYDLGRIRNSLEHIDEWLDRALYAPSDVAALSDWYLAGRSLIHSSDDLGKGEGVAGLRGFSPETGRAIFHRHQYDLFVIDIEIAKAYHNSREVQTDLLKEIRGSCLFGGGQVFLFTDDLAQRHDWWRSERAKILGEASSNPRIDGRARLWMKVQDQSQ
ncbi:hypothetical protein [Micromonospora sp. NPDC047527]|uniref:hypothetical protein n=1 Tax=Micromonospora sp. NPDC047527 TaxID=3155144 RepID=UPI0033CE2223